MHIELSGPDFLDSVADVECGNGLHINANEYRRRAREWRDQERQLELATEKIANQASEITSLRDRATRAAAALA